MYAWPAVFNGVFCPCSFSRQEDGRTVRHFANKTKLLTDASDCGIPVFSRRRRRNRVADEVHVDQKCLNPCNLSQEVEARILIRGLIERSHPVNITKNPEPSLRCIECFLNLLLASRRGCSAATTINLLHMAHCFNE